MLLKWKEEFPSYYMPMWPWPVTLYFWSLVFDQLLCLISPVLLSYQQGWPHGHTLCMLWAPLSESPVLGLMLCRSTLKFLIISFLNLHFVHEVQWVHINRRDTWNMHVHCCCSLPPHFHCLQDAHWHRSPVNPQCPRVHQDPCKYKASMLCLLLSKQECWQLWEAKLSIQTRTCFKLRKKTMVL